MKNKRKGLILLAVVLVLALGIGYAAATDTINIAGSTAAIADDFSVVFVTDHTIVTAKTDDGITVSGTYGSTKGATMTVSALQSKNDYGSAIFKAKNTSANLKATNIQATVTGDAISDAHFTIAVTYATTEEGTYSATPPTSVAADQVFYVKVTVTLAKPTANAISSTTFNVAVTATAGE